MPDSARRLLIFEEGDCLFAIEAGDAAAVVEPVEPTPIPGAIPCVLGLINLRGRLAVAVDLARLLEVTAATTAAEPAMIVLECQSRQLAVRVARVVGVLPAPESDRDIGSGLLEALGARDLAVGVGEFEGRPFLQLDVPAIFARVLDESGTRDRSPQTASIGG